jgi:hypothetical protein
MAAGAEEGRTAGTAATPRAKRAAEKRTCALS